MPLLLYERLDVLTCLKGSVKSRRATGRSMFGSTSDRRIRAVPDLLCIGVQEDFCPAKVVASIVAANFSAHRQYL